MNQGPNETPSHEPERRSFFTKAGAVACGTLVAAFPFAAGLGVVTSPLNKRNDASQGGEDAGFVPVCPLASVPEDGSPHAFVVMADVVDAWTRSPNQRIGEVYLSRAGAEGQTEIIAFTATCPHLGCAVEFDAAQSRYECPCHESGFAKDGKKLFGPSLRGLDRLDVKLKGEGDAREVWVRFERFRAGIAERIPVA